MPGERLFSPSLSCNWHTFTGRPNQINALLQNCIEDDALAYTPCRWQLAVRETRLEARTAPNIIMLKVGSG